MIWWRSCRSLQGMAAVCQLNAPSPLAHGLPDTLYYTLNSQTAEKRLLLDFWAH
jgi:hypothetical protein